MNQIGRYQIEREIGRGATGVVYLGFDPLLKRKIAVKTVLPGAATTEQPWDILLKRLTREAQAAASLSHPHIMSVHDIVAEAEMFSVVMEFIEGKTVAEAIPAGTTAELEFTIRVVKECAAALDHAHSRGIVHRDIKPANIMLDASGCAKITDFGIAKFIAATTELTRGFAIGTLEYMSPEQLNALPVDGRSDQFSLAAVAYRLLTGARIYDADSVGAWCAQLMTQRPPAASGRNSKLPRAVDAVLNRGMAMAPEKRYASCSEFASALELAMSAPVTVPQRAPELEAKLDLGPAANGAQARVGRKFIVVGAALAALAIASVVLILAGRPALAPPVHTEAVPQASSAPKPEPRSPEVPEAPVTAKEKPSPKMRSADAGKVPPPTVAHKTQPSSVPLRGSAPAAAPPLPVQQARPETPQQVTIGEQVQVANLITKVEPLYPPVAREARIQGVVRFKAVIGKDGTIQSLQYISGHPLLVQAAEDAVKQWVYKPTLFNNQPVAVATEIDVNFVLTK